MEHGEKILKIIGMKLVKTSDNIDDALIEITCLPSENMVQMKPPSLMELATGGTKRMISEMMKHQQFETKLIITQRDWLIDLKNQPFTNIKVRVIFEVDDFASDIAKEKI